MKASTERGTRSTRGGSRPRIGILMDVGVPDEDRRTLELPADYVAAVIRAGGLPLLLPSTTDAAVREELIQGLHGLLIPGGRDLNPKLYGQPLHPKTKLLDPKREAFDLAMLSLAEQHQLPTLGICLGSQTMNVQRRGTLHQHLPDVPPIQGAAIEHARPGDRTNFHPIAVRPQTRLVAALKAETLDANSRHHQGFDRLGRGLVATAHAPDGLVEAFEDPTLPFWVAVQWHPENLAGTPHDGLFSALVDAAANRQHSAA